MGTHPRHRLPRPARIRLDARNLCRHRRRHGLAAGRLIRRVRSEEHTSELQSRFDLVCRLLLEKKKIKGEVGAGKTTFIKGIGKGSGVERVITSPTFTMIKEYKENLQLYYIDANR